MRIEPVCMTGRAKKMEPFACLVFWGNVSKHQALFSIERNILMFAPCHGPL